MSQDNYKGFELFSDITDADLRQRNQAVVLANIAEDNTKNKFVSPKGAGLILGYFNRIPDAEKELVRNKFKEFMNERGYVFS